MVNIIGFLDINSWIETLFPEKSHTIFNILIIWERFCLHWQCLIMLWLHLFIMVWSILKMNSVLRVGGIRSILETLRKKLQEFNASSNDSLEHFLELNDLYYLIRNKIKDLSGAIGHWHTTDPTWLYNQNPIEYFTNWYGCIMYQPNSKRKNKIALTLEI